MKKLILLMLGLMLATLSYSQMAAALTYTINGQDIEIGIDAEEGTLIIDTWEYDNGSRWWRVDEKLSDTMTLRNASDAGMMTLLNDTTSIIIPEPSTVFDDITLTPQTTLPDPSAGKMALFDNGTSTELHQYINGQWYRYVIYCVPINP